MNESVNTSEMYEEYYYDFCDNENTLVFPNVSEVRLVFYYTLFGLGLLGRFKY